MLATLKKALVATAAIGALYAPLPALAQAQPDWEGYSNCYQSCAEAFPGREGDCTLSCKRQYGLDGEDADPNRDGSDGRNNTFSGPIRYCYGTCYPE